MKVEDDPVITRIRETRHRVAQQFDHDPQKLVAHYIALQEDYQRHLDTQTMIETTVTKVSEPIIALREGPTEYIIEDMELLAILQGRD